MMADEPRVPPKPAFVKIRREPPPPFAILRRGVKAAYVRAAELGLFGLVPLRTHVVICGFPRSGTTLLQAMVETAAQGARVFGRERAALNVARAAWPGRHGMLITKRPDDIFTVDEVRECYKSRRTDVRFVVSLRDPRAVLTSIFVDKPGYCVSPEKWRAVYEHVQYVRRFPDVTLVEYRDVVERPESVRAALATFMECTLSSSFSDFHASVPEHFDTRALNGVRPLDRESFDKWRQPKHRERIQQVLREIPELPERLVEMGYETDTEWTRAYR